METQGIDISIVILTFNRPGHLKKNLDNLEELVNERVEVIVVDNCSENVGWDYFKDQYPWVNFIHLNQNRGVYGRNVGIEASSGKYVVTLDDDVTGLSISDFDKIRDFFKEQPAAGAVCFKVIDALTKEIVNWIHHCKPEDYSDRSFLTYEITEGAVAFKREVLNATGLYPENFFISHEGPDLAYRIINKGYRVYYCPDISVEHAHAKEGRASWRRYYFDTRNSIWLAVRNYDLKMFFSRLPVSLLMMMIYSIRDGFFKYWLKGLWDGISAAKIEASERNILTKEAKEIIRGIDTMRPSMYYMLKKRLFTKKVRI